MSNFNKKLPSKRMQAHDVVLLARKHLEGGFGFNVIRLGDGEGRLMGYPRLVPFADLSESLWYWFGKDEMPDEWLLTMKSHLCEAVVYADVIGLAQPAQVKKNPEHLLPWQIMVEDLCWSLEPDGTADRRAICDKGLHRQLQERGLFDELLRDVEEVHLVTCRNVTTAFFERFGVMEVFSHRVPEEAHSARLFSPEGTIDRAVSEDHFPEAYGRLRNKIVSESRSGQLWLIGAGVLGKMYCHGVKMAGGVAIDIGSVFDGWAGIETRSYLSGQLNAYGLDDAHKPDSG